MPKLFVECSRSIKKYYPDYQYNFYSDKSMDEFMKINFSKFKRNTFDKLPVKIMKIDVFRYCLMKHIGGVYFDMDYEALKKYKFEDESGIILPMNRSKSCGDSKDEVGNSVIASEPDHPFWDYVLEQVTSNLPNTLHQYKTQKGKYSNIVLKSTGPEFLWNTYTSFTKLNPQLTENFNLLSRTAFHPSNKDVSSAYGFHHSSGVWKKTK